MTTILGYLTIVVIPSAMKQIHLLNQLQHLIQILLDHLTGNAISILKKLMKVISKIGPNYYNEQNCINELDSKTSLSPEKVIERQHYIYGPDFNSFSPIFGDL